MGHGNAAVFLDGEEAVVVDAGAGDLVARTLESHGVAEIASLVISHRHHDHDSELPSLLANPDLHIRRLFVNADPNRVPTTTFERQLRGAFRDSRKRSNTELHQANQTLGAHMSTGRLKVDVLSPDSDLAFGGVGASTETGETVGTHAMSVVLRVGVDGERAVLFGADLEYSGFRRLLDDDELELAADVLVYPHHGGRSGADDEEAFAAELARAVSPDLVVFSHGRNRFQNPRPDVVRGVRQTGDKPVRILCTQLSKNCSANELEGDERLDSTLPSRGASAGHSCSGSLRISLSTADDLLPLGAAHLRFVLGRVEGNLCLARL